MLAATKGQDGKYHLVGAVSQCSRELQLEYFRAMKSLFEAAEKSASHHTPSKIPGSQLLR
jgi:hypothetical protein